MQNIMKQTAELQYLPRYRNFTIVSKTGSVYLLNITISQNKVGEHMMSGAVNLTEDSVIKKVSFNYLLIYIIIYCSIGSFHNTVANV